MKTQTFFCPTELITGSGVLNQLQDITKPYGSVGLLVMDPFFRGKELEQRIRDLLPDKTIHVFSEVTPNPRDAEIHRGAALCREVSADFIIGLGGGSAIDSAKAISIIAANGGECWDYVKGVGITPREIKNDPLPLIAVPTTSGTGTEATRYSVVTNSVTHAKATIKSDGIFPVKALVDPELMVSMPRRTTALTGIDAFGHAFESYIGTKANVFSEMFSLQGMKLFAKSIEKACMDGQDVEARNDMTLCSTLGGLAISHSGTTLPHAIGQALSGVTDAPHGASVAVCMPSVIRWTLPECETKFAEVACIFDPSLKEKPVSEQAAALPDILDNLFIRIIGEKLTVTSFGMTEDKMEAFLENALISYGSDISRHPKIAGREDLIEIIHSCM